MLALLLTQRTNWFATVILLRPAQTWWLLCCLLSNMLSELLRFAKKLLFEATNIVQNELIYHEVQKCYKGKPRFGKMKSDRDFQWQEKVILCVTHQHSQFETVGKGFAVSIAIQCMTLLLLFFHNCKYTHECSCFLGNNEWFVCIQVHGSLGEAQVVFLWMAMVIFSNICWQEINI